MKKLTAGILASLIGLVSANSAEAAVASTKYVDDGLKTKQQKLTSENFKTDGVGEFVTGVSVDANGNVTFTSANQAQVTVDDALKQDSVNPVQNKVIAAKIAGMAAAIPTDAGNKVVKSVTQADGTVTASYAQVTGTDIAAETIESANIKDGTIATADIADSAVTSDKIASVAMAKVDGLDTALAGKQDNITWGTNITVGADGKVSATDTTYTAGAGIQLNGTEFSADVTTTVLNTELAKKQDTLKEGANIQIAADGTISATDTTYTTGTADASGLTKLYTGTGEATDGTMTQAAITTELGKKQNTLTQADNAGTGITIDSTGKISANNQLDGVDGVGEGAQVLTRAFNSQTQKWEYTWENVDREYSAQ